MTIEVIENMKRGSRIVAKNHMDNNTIVLTKLNKMWDYTRYEGKMPVWSQRMNSKSVAAETNYFQGWTVTVKEVR